MREGITISGIHSYSTFGAILASRNVAEAAQKRVIADNIPFMDGVYDFSDVLGRTYYGSRTAEYTFYLLGKDLSEKRSSFSTWLNSCVKCEIYDDLYPGVHLFGTCTGVETEQGAGRRRYKITATFTCQPYWIADEKIGFSVAVGESAEWYNEGQAARVTAIPDDAATVTVNGITESIGAETVLQAELLPGDNTFEVSSDSAGGVAFIWNETRL